MGYEPCQPMDYGLWQRFGNFPQTNWVDALNPQVITEYELLEVWVIAELTVLAIYILSQCAYLEQMLEQFGFRLSNHKFTPD